MTFPVDHPVRVLSLGAGVQSSAMLLAYLNGDLPDRPDFAVFPDTQAEPQPVYDWLTKLQEAAKGKIEIIIASKGSIIGDFLGDKGRFASIPPESAPPTGDAVPPQIDGPS